MLRRVSEGDSRAVDALLPVIYDELHRLAGAYLAREAAGHTLQTTALVHEAYLKLVGQDRAKYENRSHFLAIAAHAMRRILVNHARDRSRLKRGGGRSQVQLEESAVAAPGREDAPDLMALDEALTRLNEMDARKARTVEMRFFAGMSVDETAEALGVAPATVKRDWEFARAWLHRELARAQGSRDDVR
jgi:RNA polymerase sigma factor (TIGR02999 family)